MKPTQKNKPLERHISNETERAVLSALLEDKFAIAKISGILSIHSFGIEVHQEIFKACMELVSQNDSIEVNTVYGKLAGNDKLNEAGGIGYLLGLSAESSSSMNIESHAKVLMQFQVYRNAYQFGIDITQAATNMKDPYQIIQQAQQGAEMITQSIVLKKKLSFEQQVDKTFDRFYKAMEQRLEGGVSGVTMGFSTLDNYTGGSQGGEVIVVAARPSMGKTAFALCMATAMAKSFRKKSIETNTPAKQVVIFSYEAKDASLVGRMVSQEYERSLGALRKGVLSKGEIDQLKEAAMQDIAKLPIVINDEAGLNIESYIPKLKEIQMEYGEIGAIIIDYIGLVPTLKAGNDNSRLAHISRIIKIIAMEFDVPVFPLAQLNRGVEHRDDKRPNLSDLRDSGAVEQDADMVLFIHRPEYYGDKHMESGESSEGMAEIIFGKFREGQRNHKEILGYNGKYVKFYDLPTTQKPFEQANTNEYDYLSGNSFKNTTPKDFI